MKALGIIRKVDNLGRIVVPRELREAYVIKEGTPMEMFTNDNGDLILKRYFPVRDSLIELINEHETLDKDKAVEIINRFYEYN